MEQINSLPRVAAWFDSSSKRPCLRTTRTTIIHSIKSHLALEHPAFIWLKGSPGTGKSTIAKTITAHLEEGRRLASAIYFDKTVGHNNAFSALRFISSIAYQIALFSPDFRQVLGRRLDEDGGIRRHADWTKHIEQLLDGPLSGLSPSLTTSWVVVIDALDECGSRADLRELMTILSRFASLPLAILVTSRPEAEVEREMEGSKLSPRAVVENLDAPMTRASTESDICKYFNVGFQNLGSGDDEPPALAQIEKCATRCGGSFEVAAIQLRWLQENCDSGLLLSELLTTLLSETYPAASDPESSLYSEYIRILERAYPRANIRALGRYRLVIGTLVLLRQPLGVHPLAKLLGIGDGEVRAILKPLSSVIAVPRSDFDPISLYHASLQEFLLPSPTPHNLAPHLEYHIPVKDQETHLASRCLDTMNAELIRNICRFPDLFVPNKCLVGLSKKLETYAPHHLRYAVLHWAAHLTTSGHSAQLQSLLHRWCEEKIIFYLELMSLLDRCNAVLSLLDDAIKWAQVYLPLSRLMC